MRLDTIELSRHDVMTLASIVEKEARLSEERPVIAAVYMNRLRDHMLLQADPTVQYALGEHQNRVLYKHLEVESAYNTYKHAGLPPGPVASPGRASISPHSIQRMCPTSISSLFRTGTMSSGATLRSRNRAPACSPRVGFADHGGEARLAVPPTPRIVAHGPVEDKHRCPRPTRCD